MDNNDPFIFHSCYNMVVDDLVIFSVNLSLNYIKEKKITYLLVFLYYLTVYV